RLHVRPALRAIGRRQRRNGELRVAVEQLQEALAHGAGRTENAYPDFRHGSSLTLSDARGMYQLTTEVVVVIARGVALRGLFCFPKETGDASERDRAGSRLDVQSGRRVRLRGGGRRALAPRHGPARSGRR